MAPSRSARDDTDDELVWYFAYGSNMLAAKFSGSRGIHPRKAARVRTPGWTLALDIPGMPYQEPTFTSLRPRADADADAAPAGPAEPPVQRPTPPDAPARGPGVTAVGERDALGVAYLITAAQYARVIASEGGGIAYADVALGAAPVGEPDREVTGGEVTVRTLAGVMRRAPWPKPSARYMKLVTDGAEEAGLPQEYRRYLQDLETYEPPRSRRGQVGAAIFVGFWGPVMGMMETITHATTGVDGYCPRLVIWLVRLTMVLIWLTHDVFFAPLFGRGDGYEHGESRSPNARLVDEEKALLKSPVN